MKNQYQTTPTDCLRACIATILEVPILGVPDFSQAPDGESEYPGWYVALQKYVERFGFVYIEVMLAARPWNPIPAEILCIFHGNLPGGSRHSIVGKVVDYEFVPIFDPMGGDALPFEGNQIESVAFLIPRNPMLMLNMGTALEEIEQTSRGITNRIVGDSIANAARFGLGKRSSDAPTILGPNGAPVESNGHSRFNGNGD